MLKILLVKMSSMGDLIHNLPVVSDLKRCYPDALIDWVVEEGYVDIPILHPGLHRLIPIALRRWRNQLFARETYRELGEFKRSLQREHYDFVFDTQGLMKSGAIGRLANAKRRYGYASHCTKEPLAALFYDVKLPIAKSVHVIERNRAVAAQALGYSIAIPPEFQISVPPLKADWLPRMPYSVLMHAASRPEKLWAEDHWLTLAKELNRRGLHCILPWGTAEEQARSQRLTQQMQSASIAPKMNLREAMQFLAGARLVAGLDTGFSHIAAALAVPTIGIYCDSDSQQAAITSTSFCVSLGKKGKPPTIESVLSILDQALLGHRQLER